jgi:hypothetical protein
VENAECLEALLEALIAIDFSYLTHHPKTPLLVSPAFGVQYGRTDDWLTIPAMKLRGFADCKSLSAMRIAEKRIRGLPAKPVFRFRDNNRGGTDYHILVQTSKGFEDPSKECGMLANEWSYFKS